MNKKIFFLQTKITSVSTVWGTIDKYYNNSSQTAFITLILVIIPLVIFFAYLSKSAQCSVFVHVCLYKGQRSDIKG